MKDKFKDEDILTIIDTEDTAEEEEKKKKKKKKAKNEEQVNRILNAFKSYGVANPGSKRKLDEDTAAVPESGKRKKHNRREKRKLRSETDKSPHNGEGLRRLSFLS